MLCTEPSIAGLEKPVSSAPSGCRRAKRADEDLAVRLRRECPDGGVRTRIEAVVGVLRQHRGRARQQAGEQRQGAGNAAVDVPQQAQRRGEAEAGHVGASREKD